jgi:hypothetical protein
METRAAGLPSSAKAVWTESVVDLKLEASQPRARITLARLTYSSLVEQWNHQKYTARAKGFVV